jgi:hypothetical protein
MRKAFLRIVKAIIGKQISKVIAVVVLLMGS